MRNIKFNSKDLYTFVKETSMMPYMIRPSFQGNDSPTSDLGRTSEIFSEKF